MEKEGAAYSAWLPRVCLTQRRSAMKDVTVGSQACFPEDSLSCKGQTW